MEMNHDMKNESKVRLDSDTCILSGIRLLPLIT